MSAFSELLVQAILPTIEAVGESKLVDLLQKLHNSNPDEYKDTIIAGNLFIAQLSKYCAGTTTKIDDAILLLFQQAIQQSADNNNVKL